ELVGVIEKQREGVVDAHRREMAVGRIGLQAKNPREELRRGLLVAGGDDGVVEGDGHRTTALLPTDNGRSRRRFQRARPKFAAASRTRRRPRPSREIYDAAVLTCGYITRSTVRSVKVIRRAWEDDHVGATHPADAGPGHHADAGDGGDPGARQDGPRQEISGL